MLMTDGSHDLKLQTRSDDFSYQVSAENDQRFWFRLERKLNRDVITDFNPGSLHHDDAGAALTMCYEHLGLRPQQTVVFRDIMSSADANHSQPTFARPLDDVLDSYVGWGKALLNHFGNSDVDERVERRRQKLDLILRVVL